MPSTRRGNGTKGRGESNAETGDAKEEGDNLLDDDEDDGEYEPSEDGEDEGDEEGDEGDEEEEGEEEEEKSSSVPVCVDEDSRVNEGNSKRTKAGVDEEAEKRRLDNLWASFLEGCGEEATSTRDHGTGESSRDPSDRNVDRSGGSSCDRGGTQNDPIAFAAPASRGDVGVSAGEESRETANEIATGDRLQDDSDPKNAGEEGTKRGGSAQTASASNSEQKPPKRPLGGLAGAVAALAKRPKASVLEKSNRDWESFKSETGIQEELATHNRGRSGYIDRMDFLTRADHRQFEAEKSARESLRARQQRSQGGGNSRF